MMYTDHAIYSSDVIFFRDERFKLMKRPVTASLLTLPAVNYGQVVFQGGGLPGSGTHNEKPHAVGSIDLRPQERQISYLGGVRMRRVSK
ncbi:hypothetical protein J2TS4_53050 [Paenibacillus sp. J2TS4]|nr:hypothetical protein J2TS4_53050 [Paenibacillus sp. J2TS4]